ncbi:MAG: hypothetical protein ABR898_01160 [Terracidiphilus sp.]
MRAELKGHPNRLGIYVAAVYVLIVVGVFAITVSAKPSGLGYEWIPFITIAMPWYYWLPNGTLGAPWYIMIAPELCILGITLNAGILYLFGTLLEKLRRRLFWK